MVSSAFYSKVEDGSYRTSILTELWDDGREGRDGDASRASDWSSGVGNCAI